MVTAITVLHVAATVVLAVAAFLVLVRMAKGPSSLDRSVAADVMIAILIAATGLFAITSRQDTMLPVLVVLSLLGFTAAVGMSRLISNRSAQVRELLGTDKPRGDRAVSLDATGPIPAVRADDTTAGTGSATGAWDDSGDRSGGEVSRG